MTTAFSPSRRASGFGVLTSFKNLAPGGFGLQQRIAVIGRGASLSTYTLDKRQVFSAQEAGETYGFGSPIHEMVYQLLPPSGDGVGDIPVTVYPLADGNAGSFNGVTPGGSSPTTAETLWTIDCNNIQAQVLVPAGTNTFDLVAFLVGAITAEPRMPIEANNGITKINYTSKWHGETANELTVSITSDIPVGPTFADADLASGSTLAGHDYSPLFDQFGDVWETMIISGLGSNTDFLDAVSAFNEGRWSPAVSKPMHGSYYTTRETSVATAIVVPDARGSDRTNVQLSAPGSNDSPWALTARMAAQVALVANSRSPASDYSRRPATGMTPGADGDQWNSAERDTAVKAGASTSAVRDGVLTLLDTVTMYHPSGDPTPAFRYVNDIVKLQQLISDVRAIFDSPDWAGAPLLPDGQTTRNRSAKRPSMARAALFKLIGDWGLKALISDPGAAKDSVLAAIDGSNQRRLNLEFTVQLSGNAGIISTDLNFGFFFGS